MFPDSLHVFRDIHENESEKNRLALTRDEDFINGYQDVFDMMAKFDQEKPLDKAMLKRSMNATIELLKKAQINMRTAHDRLENQYNRIQNLEKLGTVDELTGLSNLRGLEGSLEREIAKIERGYHAGGLMLTLEIENLKNLNERYGLSAAGACLKLVARHLRHEMRATDVAARIDADVFAIMFSNAKSDDVLSRAQALSLRLNNLSLIWSGQEIQINVSVSLKAFDGTSRAKNILGI